VASEELLGLEKNLEAAYNEIHATGATFATRLALIFFPLP
jgi:hypothetical protein